MSKSAIGDSGIRACSLLPGTSIHALVALVALFSLRRKRPLEFRLGTGAMRSTVAIRPVFQRPASGCFVGLFAIIVPIWILSPVAPAKQVFTVFRNHGGWDSYGTATLVGFDYVVHMSEEVQDASLTMPRALNASFLFNNLFGLSIIITIAFTIRDIDNVLATPTGTTAVQWILNSTGSVGGTNVMITLVSITLFAAVIAEVAAASRQLSSSARERDAPGHRWVAHITHGSNIRLNAVMISFAVTSASALVNLGSTTALNAIISLALVALLISYTVCIGYVALRRVRGQPLPKRKWSLGKLGLPINIAACLFLVPLFVFACFPPTASLTAFSMNYGVVMFTGVIFLALAYYAVHGRKVYVSPVVHVDCESEK
ncbi:hypothetical protein D0866_00064 [Hortaea werneckii]|uniref:Amino acid permease/ SLC12A domain-containing protein n=1 Tax=Hortaea werneckii TaxID=91943 RepID=A0A3M7BR26_HORWE|nr:hypothetical protein D0866_00064 [Hortaea werneckii]